MFEITHVPTIAGEPGSDVSRLLVTVFVQFLLTAHTPEATALLATLDQQPWNAMTMRRAAQQKTEYFRLALSWPYRTNRRSPRLGRVPSGHRSLLGVGQYWPDRTFDIFLEVFSVAMCLTSFLVWVLFVE